MIDFLMIERIKQNKGLAAFSCIFIVIFTLLGFWQIERGILKAELLDKFNIEQTGSTTDFTRLYTGTMDNKLLLFDDLHLFSFLNQLLVQIRCHLHYLYI